MDTFVFSQPNDTAYVVITESAVSGGGRLAYKMTLDDRRTVGYMCTAAVNLSSPVVSSRQAVVAPDMYCLEVTTQHLSACVSVYRYPFVANPCNSVDLTNLTTSFNLTTLYALATGFTITDPTDPLLVIEIDTGVNVTITDSGTKVRRLGQLTRLATQLDGRLVMFGGNGTMALQRLDKRAQSFDCESADQSVALDYCVAPSMHRCRDFHLKPECRPPSTCNGRGNYSAMTHTCTCNNNYDGTYCEWLACDPPCVYGDCITSNGTCHCWPHAIGAACDHYYIVTDEQNLTISTGAIMALDSDNHSNYTVPGWLTITDGTSLFVLMGHDPAVNDHVTLITFRHLVGRFHGVHASPLPDCMRYYVFYNPTTVELLFYNGCPDPNAVNIPGYIIISVVGLVVLTAVTYVLLVRFSMRFRQWATPCRLCWQKFTLPSDGSGGVYIRKRRLSFADNEVTKPDEPDDANDNDMVVPESAKAKRRARAPLPEDPMVLVTSIRSTEIAADDTDAFVDH
jgi:hypothetical protein